MGPRFSWHPRPASFMALGRTKKRENRQSRAPGLPKPDHPHRGTLSTLTLGLQNWRRQNQRECRHLSGFCCSSWPAFHPLFWLRGRHRMSLQPPGFNSHLTRQMIPSQNHKCMQRLYACAHTCPPSGAQNPELRRHLAKRQDLKEGVERGREGMREHETKSEGGSRVRPWQACGAHLQSLNLRSVLPSAHLNMAGNPIPSRSPHSRKDHFLQRCSA